MRAESMQQSELHLGGDAPTAVRGRLVMRWDKPTRLAYYADVKKKRGAAAAQQLIEETKRQWNATQQSLL